MGLRVHRVVLRFGEQLILSERGGVTRFELIATGKNSKR